MTINFVEVSYSDVWKGNLNPKLCIAMSFKYCLSEVPTLSVLPGSTQLCLNTQWTAIWVKDVPAKPQPSWYQHRNRWWRALFQVSMCIYLVGHEQWNRQLSRHCRISVSVCNPCKGSPHCWCSHPLCKEVGRQWNCYLSCHHLLHDLS